MATDGQAKFKTFRVGPKNLKLEDPVVPGRVAEPSGYGAVVDSELPLADLTAWAGIEILPGELEMSAAIFQYPAEARVERRFELFEFPKRADYGRDGVNETFVRERLAHFGYRPATLVELICLGGYLRAIYRDQWYEARNIVALGSVAATEHVVKKGGWFSKAVTATYRHYPELLCIAGRPIDQLRLTTTDQNKHGNWPNEILFLATELG